MSNIEVANDQNSNIYLDNIKAFRKIFCFENKDKIEKEKYGNKEAKDNMNIFQCLFPQCKRNYFDFKDWSFHYRYHVN